MLFLHNDSVAALLSMKDCIDVQDRAFRGLETGASVQRPRIDIYTPCAREDGYYRWGTYDAAFDGILAHRLKSDIITWPKYADGTLREAKHCIEPGTFCGLVLLFSTDNGAPLAIMNDGHLQHMRVGGGAGLGARYLAREESEVVGMIGSGGMARCFLEAMCAVRPIRRARVYSRSPENRNRFATEMAARLGIEIDVVDDPQSAVRGADIVCTCTDSMVPVLDPDWIEPGAHVTNLGPRELSVPVRDRFDVSIRQGNEGLQMEETAVFRKDIGHSPGAFVGGTPDQQKRLPRSRPRAERVSETPLFVDLVSGRSPGRTSLSEITHYEAIGNFGLQFAAVGGAVYRCAVERGVGRDLPTEWFLQDIRN